MPKYMLSFDKGKLVAYIIDKKKEKIVERIYILIDNGKDPEIECEDMISFLDDTIIESVRKSMRLNKVEGEVLHRALEDKTGRN